MVDTSTLGGKLGRVFALNLLLKLVSFSLTVVLTRQLVPQAKGVGFAFDLYVNCMGFLVREALRAAAARIPITQPRDVHRIASAGVLTLPLYALLIPLFAAHWAYVQPEGFRAVCTAPVIALYVGGTLFELLSEPVQLLWAAMLHLRPKLVGEALGVMLRLTVLTALVAHFKQRDGDVTTTDAAVAYAVGHFVGCGFILAFQLVSMRRWVGQPHDTPSEKTVAEGWASLTPSVMIAEAPAFLARPVVSGQPTGQALLWQFGTESALRLVLTEGEKVVLSARGNFAEQGMYDLVASLGSMVVRMVFRVWEDFAFQAWSRSDAAAGTVSAQKWALFHVMLRLALTFGAFAVVFGPVMSTLFIRVLYGDSWAGADAVLAVYCYYLPLLGLNGLCEAFVRGTGTVPVLRRAKVAAMACSAVYIGACYAALFVFGGGIVWLVVVNCANMIIRVGIAFTLIGTGVAKGVGAAKWAFPILPQPLALGVYAASFGATRLLPLHVGVPMCLVACLAAAVNDNTWLRELALRVFGKLKKE